MSDEIKINRRSFIISAISLSALSPIQPQHKWTAPFEQNERSSFGPRLTKLLGHKESAKIIGIEYLKIAPHEADKQILVDLLYTGFTQANVTPVDADTTKLSQLLELRMRLDFEEEKIVKLRGWIVSLTEARLCALASLSKTANL